MIPRLEATSAPSGVNGPIVEGIQQYRDAYVPEVFQPPSPAWMYADVAVLTLLLIVATVLVWRGAPARWLTRTLIVAGAYFGLFRGGCLCPVGATSNVALGIVRPELIGRAELALFLVPLVGALVAGRVFCGSACPLGAVQHACGPKKRGTRKLPVSLAALPVIVLALTVAAAITGAVFLVCRLDPYRVLFAESHLAISRALAPALGQPVDFPPWYAGTLVAWLIFTLLLLCGWVVPRVFCRYLCPYGVLLGAFATVAVLRRRPRLERCTGCARCAAVCPTDAVRWSGGSRRPTFSAYACVQCNRCADACERDAIVVCGDASAAALSHFRDRRDSESGAPQHAPAGRS